MMTTYELIRRLAQLDPTGTKPVMLSINYKSDDKIKETSAFINELWVECPDDVAPDSWIVLTGLDEE